MAPPGNIGPLGIVLIETVTLRTLTTSQTSHRIQNVRGFECCSARREKS